MNPEERKKQAAAKNRTLLFVALGALLLALVFIIMLTIKNSAMKDDLQQLEAEKELQRQDFQAEVDSLMRVHNELKESYGELSQELAEKDSIIQADAVEIKKLLDSQWDYYRIKKKLSSLQEISQKYVRQMDSLYTVNRELVAENERIREEYQAEKRQNTNLTRQNDELAGKVNIASAIKIHGLTANGVRFKGNSKEAVTDRANRTERIMVDFTMVQNDLIETGPKTFYLRIADPTKNVISKGTGDDFSFTTSTGETLQYTERVRVNYDGKDAPVRAYYIKPSAYAMMPGRYYIDVYEQGGKLVGQTSLELK